MTLKNQVQLITYPDSLGKNLVELHFVLRKYLRNRIGGLHLLPFYPSSADRGFAPLTYDDVDPGFGTWRDVEEIAHDFDLMIDFMVNHISRQSLFFQDYVVKGASSEFADMFLSFNKLSPDGEIPEEEMAKVYTRKPRPPYTVIQRADGSNEKIWGTFDFEQIDLDWKSPKTLEVMSNYLIRLARLDIRMLRLDAIGYAPHRIGTNCFFLEPEIWELLEWIKNYTDPFDTEVVPEVHESHDYQLRMAEKGYWVYDFALPMLVLHTLYRHTNRRLIEWLKICPHKQFTTLDTHDGIGVVDVAKLMSEEEIEATIEGLYEKGSNVKRLHANPEYQNLDIYQVNCTYYSALGADDDAYIASRAIQFFTPGIPQVYYVGLLAGENDIELLEKTKNGRDINRHNYSLNEIAQEMEKPVVQRLLRLMEFRNGYQAFNGSFHIQDTDEDRLSLAWVLPPYQAHLDLDLKTFDTRITYFDPESNGQVVFAA